MLLLPKSLQQSQIPKLLVLLALLVLVAFGAIPAYLQGHLPWTHLPRVTTIKQLQTLRKTGLALPGWQATAPQTVQIGGHRWIAQQITPPANQAAGLLSDSQILSLIFPQDSSTAQPQVEWLDINGFLSASQLQAANRPGGAELERPSSHGWKTDEFQLRSVANSVSGSHPITVSFFRGRTPNQTYAVLQWYAWTGGGHPDIYQWFWADQMAQLRGKRLPWVAICVLIPIEPLGDITKVWAIAEPLSQAIQSVLMTGPLQP